MALNTGLFNVAPGESAKEVDARRRMAMALMQEGMSTEPIRSPWQGAANIAKSLIGGYDLYKLDQADAAKEAQMQKGIEDEIRALGPQDAVRVNPSLSGGGLTPKPSPVVSALSATSVDAGTKAGLYDPSVTKPPQPVASALAGPASTPTAAPERRTPRIAQEEMDSLLRMSKNPTMRAPLMQHLMELQKPKDQWVMEKTPEGTYYSRNLSSGEVKWSPAAPNMSVTSVADPVLKGVGDAVIERRKAADSAATSIIPSIHEARNALDQGAITGAAADPRLFVTKVGALFGLASPERIANTEVLQSATGNQVLAHAKSLGANPSNTDRDYIEKVIGGSIKLDETSIRRLLDMQEKWARDSIKRFNLDASKLMRGNQSMYGQIAPLMQIDEPSFYTRQAKPGAPASTRPAIPQGVIKLDDRGNRL